MSCNWIRESWWSWSWSWSACSSSSSELSEYNSSCACAYVSTSTSPKLLLTMRSMAPWSSSNCSLSPLCAPLGQGRLGASAALALRGVAHALGASAAWAQDACQSAEAALQCACSPAPTPAQASWASASVQRKAFSRNSRPPPLFPPPAPAPPPPVSLCVECALVLGVCARPLASSSSWIALAVAPAWFRPAVL